MEHVVAAGASVAATPAHALAVVACGLLAAAVSVLQRRSAYEPVPYRAAELLRTLARLPATRDDVVAAGGVHAVRRAMENRASKPAIVWRLLSALSWLAAAELSQERLPLSKRCLNPQVASHVVRCHSPQVGRDRRRCVGLHGIGPQAYSSDSDARSFLLSFARAVPEPLRRRCA